MELITIGGLTVVIYGFWTLFIEGGEE